MARSQPEIKKGDEITVDGVKIIVIGGRARLKIKAKSKPVVIPARNKRLTQPPE